MFSFLQKLLPKKKEAAPAEEGGEESSEAAPAPAAGGDAAAQVSALSAQLTMLKTKFESAQEMRKADSERFASINEQIGELRGMITDTNKSVSTIEVKATKAADLVESVHPDKVMIELQKEDGKIEALRANIESNEEMMKSIMDQLKKMRSQITIFRGTEQVLKMNEDVKKELLDIKKIEATCEQHADKVETVFSELQKTYQEVNEFAVKFDDLKQEFSSLGSKMNELQTKIATFVTKKQIADDIAKSKLDGQKAKKLLNDIADAHLKHKDEVKVAQKKLELQFELYLSKAKTLSDAFQKVLEENPLFARGLDLQSYLDEKVHQVEAQLAKLEGKEPAGGGDASGEGESPEGEEGSGEEGAEEAGEGSGGEEGGGDEANKKDS